MSTATTPITPAPAPSDFGPKVLHYWRTLPTLRFLLPAVPATAVLEAMHAAPAVIFVTSCLAILALVTLIGKATEEIALYTNPTIGGLLNATFGNVTELIIAGFALQQGLYGIVKSSIVGSILGNLLLLLGAAMLIGGLRHPRQTFNSHGSNASVSMMALSLVAMVIPAIIAHGAAFDPDLADDAVRNRLLGNASIAIAIVMLVVYFLSLVFQLRTHRSLLAPTEHEHAQPQWPRGGAIAALLGITLIVAWQSDVFVASLDGMMRAHPIFTPTFMGVIVVAIVGNAAEGSVAIWVARENKMELAFQVAMGSSLQVALFVAPVLLLMSYFVGPHPMTLDFSILETASIWASVLVASQALSDGESHWFEGVVFLAVYVIFGVVFFFHP